MLLSKPLEADMSGRFVMFLEVTEIRISDFTTRPTPCRTCDWFHSHLNSWSYHVIYGCQNRVMHAIFDSHEKIVVPTFHLPEQSQLHRCQQQNHLKFDLASYAAFSVVSSSCE